MQAGTARLPLYAAGLTVIVVAAAVTGCAASSSSAGASGSSAPPVTPLAAIKLAANVSAQANTFTGTMSLQSTAAAGAASSADVSMSASFAEQLHPSLLASVDIESLSTAGTSLPGGLTELITPTDLYLKWSYLTQLLHLTKPWLVAPLSTLGNGTGASITQLINQATGNSPLSQSQLFADATSVRQAGTGTIAGVPVTEYTGTVPLNSKTLSNLPGTLKTQVAQYMNTLGVTSENFTVWIDGQHLTRKAVVTLAGKSTTETVTLTITSINKPINVSVPPASQTSPLPASALG